MRSMANALLALTALSVQAQVLLTGPNNIAFTAASGGAAPASQAISIRTTGDTQRAFSIVSATTTGGNWLGVSSLSGTTPARVNLTANPAGLPVGSYSGTLVISASGLASAQVNVTLTIAASTQLTALPTSLAFQRQLGVDVAAGADDQIISINTTGTASSFSIATSTTDNGPWLQATGSASTPGLVTVRVNPAGLLAGTYNGNVAIASQGLTSLTIPVTLTISPNPFLSASTNIVNIAAQRSAGAATQTIALQTSNGSNVGFTTTVSVSSGGNWLIASPLIGTAPGSIDISVNPAGLTPGTYSGAVQIAAPSAANPAVTVVVNFTVTDFPIISVAPKTLSLNIASDVTQTTILRDLPAITVTGNAGNTPYTTSVSTFNGGAWLLSGPSSGATTGTITSLVDASGLPPGIYRGQISVTGQGNSVTIPVAINVSGNAQIAVDPATVVFNVQKNQTPPSNQIVNVTSTGAAYSFQSAVTTITPANATWLTGGAATGTTPSPITLGVNSASAGGLPNGQYTATITFSGQPGMTPPLSSSPTLNVVLNVSDTALFNVSPATVDFATAANSNNFPAPRIIAITSTDASSRPFSVATSTTSGGNWLLVGPTAGNTPTNLTVQVLPFGLAPGLYEGSIQVTVPSISTTPQSVRVRMLIQPNVTIAASPTSLTFTQANGGASPAPRAIAVTASGVANYQVTTSTNSGGAWLNVSPASGTTPGNINVSVSGSGLAPATYQGSIGIVSPDISNSPVLIPVTFTVNAPTLTVTPNPVSLVATPGSTTPVTQQLTVTSGSSGFTTTVATQSGGNWLSVASATGSSPTTVTISANPAGLAGGTYTGTITFTASGVVGSPLVVNVTFTVVATAPAGRQILSQIADGAGWKTSIIITNLDTDAAPFTLRFFANDGTPLRLPFEGSPGRLESLQGIIPVGGTRTILTLGTDTALSQGWAELTSTKVINGLGIFRQRVDGRPDQEAAVSAILPSSRFMLPFDNLQGFVSSMALANTNATASRATTVTPRNEDGTNLLGDSVNLPPLGYTSFAMSDRFPSMAGRRGAAEFNSSGPDFAALGLRFNNTGAFTSLPTLDVPVTVPAAEVTKVMSQVADGAGWKTVITLVNLDTVPAPFTIRFWRQDGVAQQVPLAGGQTLDTITDTIPVGGTRVIETLGGSTPLVQGWAQMTTTRNVNGLAVFRQRVAGRPDQEAAVTLTSTSSKFVMPFDNTTDFVTSMALVNTSATLGATISVIIRDESGAQIAFDAISLAGRGYSAFSLADRFASTRARRGSVEFSSTSQITGLGLRFNSGGAFTSFPVLPKQ